LHSLAPTFMRIHKIARVLLMLLIFTTSAPLLLPSFGSARVLAQTVDVKKQEADRLLDQGNEQHDKNQLGAALQSYQQALAIYREIKDRQKEVGTITLIGTLYHELGDYSKSLAYYQQALNIAKEIKDSQLEAFAQQLLTLLSKDRQNPRKVEADRLLDQGNEQHGKSQFATALQSYQQALSIYREIKDRQKEGGILGNLGSIYNIFGDYPKAIDYLQQALKIAQEIKDRRGESYALGNLSSIYNHLGDYPKAIDYIQQSLKIAQEIKDREGEVYALNSLGGAYNNLGDYPKAIDYHQQSLKVTREIKNRQQESYALAGLGNVYDSLGDYAGAIDYFQQTLKITQENKDRRGESYALGSLGNVYNSLGNYTKGIDYLQQSLKIVREIQDREGESIVLGNLGVAFYREGNLRSAESSLFEAIKVKESLRGRELKDSQKVLIADIQQNTYRILQQVLIAQNKINSALEISERGRGRAFAELLTSRISSDTQLFSASPTIAEIKETAKTHNTTLVQYSTIYDKNKELELYIWVIKPNGNITFRKVDLKPLWQKDNTNLSELVTTVRNNIGARGTSYRGLQVNYNPDNTNTKNNLRRLHQLLIDPIADLLPKNVQEKVAFIPQASLFLVPFPALQDANGKYLVEKHTILTAPSIQVLDLTRKQREAQKTPLKDVLIVGNPTMPFVAPKIGATPQQLAPLPGAEREAKAIGNLLNTKPLIGNAATKAAVLERLPRARFVHLATHGIFDDIQGINSSIALAPDINQNKQTNNDGNGLLTAGEILDLKLNAELVVLSACDTGRGKITGDGVIGLSRALISAGVPSVLVSLWSVPDAPTSLLMTEFYKNLQKNPDKAQALRQAMLTTMKSSPNPVDWAAFTLIGEAN
jgi:CHAT domain-containing protein/Flp pilus assembly protein TadD